MANLSGVIYGAAVSFTIIISMISIVFVMFRLVQELLKISITIDIPAEDSDGEAGGESGRRKTQHVITRYAMPDIWTIAFLIVPFAIIAAMFIGILHSGIFDYILPIVFPNDNGTGAGLEAWVRSSRIIENAVWDFLNDVLQNFGLDIRR